MRKELKIKYYSVVAHDGNFFEWMQQNHPDVILIICNTSGYFEDDEMLENVFWEMYCREEE